MFSRGSIGGAPVGAYVVAGGPFVEEAEGSIAVAVQSTAEMTRRQTTGGACQIALTGAMAASLRASAAGSLTIGIGTDVVAVRRASAIGAVSIDVAADLEANRRASATAELAIGVGLGYLAPVWIGAALGLIGLLSLAPAKARRF